MTSTKIKKKMEIELYFRNTDIYCLQNFVIRVFKSSSKDFKQASLSNLRLVLKVYDIFKCD